MVETRSSENRDPMKKILDMLTADRQARELDRQQMETCFQRLETMVESMKKRDEVCSSKATINEEATSSHNHDDGNFERWRKLEIPIYDGDTDPYSWVNKLERFFQIQGILEAEKIQAVMVALEGKALSWFQWWETCNSNITWEEFKLALTERFQSSAMLTPFAALLALKQEDTVEEYVEQFEKFAGMLKKIDEDHLKDIFVNGLKEDIGAEIKLYKPPSLSIMVKKALMIEQKNRSVWKMSPISTSNSGLKFTPSYNSHSHSKAVSIDAKQNVERNYTPTTSFARSTTVSKPENKGRPEGFRRFSDAEIQEKVQVIEASTLKKVVRWIMYLRDEEALQSKDKERRFISL